MTASPTGQQAGRGVLLRVRQAYGMHREFVFLLILFSVLQLMLLIFFAPGGRFGDYSDYWYYLEMASRLDSGYYPYIHYWVEYPPLFPWLPVGAYGLSRLLPPAPQPQLWFYAVFGVLMGLFAIGNLVMVYLLGLQLYDRRNALRCAWFYALLFGPVFVHAGWFDGAALFFMLWSLYLLFKNRAMLSGMMASVGAMIKVLPLALAPVGFKILSHRWRYLLSIGLVLAAVNLPFYLLNPALFTASWRSLLTTPSWETVWALLDGYYSYGLALGNRFDPAQAGSGQRPEFVPWSAVLVVFGLAYLAVYLLPWQRSQPDRTAHANRNWLLGIVDQFLNPVMRDGSQTVNKLGVVAFVGLGLNLFMIFSRGFSPQFVLWYLPFLILALPNGWGLAYATLLTIDSVIERVLYFFVVPDAHWLLFGTVLFRTVLMLLLIPEYLAVMGFLPLPRWRRVQRWLLPPAALAMIVLLVLGVGAFARDYRESRYAESSLQHVVDRIRNAAPPDDGLVITSRDAYDKLAPFLPDQEARLYTRDDGEFRPAVFEAQWAGFVSRHPRVWLLLDYAGGQNADWNAHLMERLGQSGYQTVDEWVGEEQRLVHYAAVAPIAVRTEEVNAVFADEVELVRVRLDGEPLRGGEVLRLKLRWQPMLNSGREYKVFLHLVSEQGEILAQRDLPVMDSTWPNRAGLLLPRGLEPGAYRLQIGVYDPATGDRLPISTGKDSVVIEGIEIR